MFINVLEWLYLVSAFATAWTIVLVAFLFVCTRKRFVKWSMKWADQISSMVIEIDEENDKEEP